MNISAHKLAAVVILYNPQNSIVEIIKNIESYAKYLSFVYLVDNSNDNSSLLINASFKFKYFLNKNKGGIGGAQNIGCSEALKMVMNGQ